MGSKNRDAIARYVSRIAGPGAVLYAWHDIYRLADALHTWWWRGHGPWPDGGMTPTTVATAVHRGVDLVGHAFMTVAPAALLLSLFVSIFLLPVGLVFRALARTRVRRGAADPLDVARRWVGAHPRPASALTAVPATLAMFVVAIGKAHGDWLQEHDSALLTYAAFAVPAALASTALAALARADARALLAPTVDATLPVRTDVGQGEITFRAVAVTRETIAAVGLMAAMTAAICVLPWFAIRSPITGAAALAYVIAAVGGSLLFYHASKISIGVDGVLVKGTSRTRFFGYRELDAARVRGTDLELLRGDRVVLRLQLHGKDAARGDAILARVQESILRVKRGSDARAEHIVASVSPEHLARAAGGGADYRTSPLSRDELWALVEGPSVDRATREAAAAALARTGDDEQRTRLRVAAASCAEPQVRVALAEIIESGEPIDEIAERRARHA